jgi:hypothetical protein
MSRPDDGPRSRRRRRHGAPDPHPAESYGHGADPYGPGDPPYDRPVGDDRPYGRAEATAGRESPRWEPEPAPVRPVGPPRRSRTAVTALVLGVLAIPLFFTVYIGALVGLLGLVLGLVALGITRGGRVGGRAMAVAGTVCALIGLVMSVALGIYGIKTYRDCQQRLGHKPTIAEVRDCTRG